MKTVAEIDAVIEKYTDVPFAQIRDAVRRSTARNFIYSDGRMMFNVPERDLHKTSTHKFELVGVYDYRVKAADLRSDLAWYVNTYLEAA